MRDWQKMAEDKYSQALEQLELECMQIEDNNISAIIVGSKTFIHRIKSLRLWYNKIGPKGTKQLCYTFSNLINLDLNNNNIKDEGLRHIANGIFEQLRILRLWQNGITNGLKYLAAGKLKNLVLLDLNNNKINDEGIKFLSNGVFGNLTELYLQGNKIGIEGCKHLVCASFRNLTTLTLLSNRIFSLNQTELRKLVKKSKNQLSVYL